MLAWLQVAIDAGLNAVSIPGDIVYRNTENAVIFKRGYQYMRNWSFNVPTYFGNELRTAGLCHVPNR